MEVAVKEEALRRFLARRCWYQKDLARAAKISPSYLSQIVHGSREPSAGVRQRILRTLGDLTFDDLFEIRD